MTAENPVLRYLPAVRRCVGNRTWQGFAASMTGWTLFWLAALCQWPTPIQNAAALLFFAGLVLPGMPFRHAQNR